MIDSTKALGGRPRLGAQGVLDSRRERRELGLAATNTEGKQSTVDKAGPSLVFVAQSTAMAELGEIHGEGGVCVQQRAGEEEPGDISLEKEVDFSLDKEADLSLDKEADLSLEGFSDQDLVEQAFEEEFKSKYDVYM